MQAQLKVRSNLIITVEEEAVNDLFEGLSHAQEVFEQEKCGHCGCTDLRFVVRQDDSDNKYYELHCTAVKCRARLPFGLAKKGGNLYPKKRWDSLSKPKNDSDTTSEQTKRANEKAHAEANYGFLPNGGWYKYVPPKK